MPAAVRPDVRSFFERYQQATDSLDTDVLEEVFHDFFLSLDPGSAYSVSRDALLAALPARGAAALSRSRCCLPSCSAGTRVASAGSWCT